MRVFLSNIEPEDKSYIWINNIAILNEKILNAEATHIVCDNFISNFMLAECQQLFLMILSKMRLNCELIIKDVDMDILNRRYINEEITITEANNILFSSNNKRKSLLNMSSIEINVPQNMALTNKTYDYSSCSFIMKYRRAK